jgi:hypothetical protein
MRLIHFSNRSIAKVGRRAQHSPDDHLLYWSKPEGLWVSDETNAYGWREWVRDNLPRHRLRDYRVANEVTLANDANILVISDAAGLDAFTNQFGRRDRPTCWLNWSAVAEQWQGIVITPHIMERHGHASCLWYMVWEVASGCIWDPAAIASIRRL